MLPGVIVLALDPGADSTRLALAELQPAGESGKRWLQLRLEQRVLNHPELSGDAAARQDGLLRGLHELLAGWPSPQAVVGPGGPGGPLAAGTYAVTPALAQAALAAGVPGPALALALAQHFAVPAYVVDPPGADELTPEARLTGWPGVGRSGRFPVLAARAVARRAAHEVGKRFGEARVVVAQLDEEVSVTAFARGRAVDTSGSEAPFGPRRAGQLPTAALLELAYSGRPRAELEHQLAEQGGFLALTGHAELTELERLEKSDMGVKLAVGAHVHAVAKAIGAYAAALEGRPDAIALSGAAARWEGLVDRIERRVGWIAPVIVLPGDLALEALAEGAGRVLLGLEEARSWAPEPGA